MPDSHKPFGQYVQQKPPDELHRINRCRLHLVGLPVLVIEGHLAVFKRYDAMIGNRYPVGVTADILKDIFGLFYSVASHESPIFWNKAYF